MSGNKAVVTVSPSESIAHQVRFTPERFNELVYDKGYEVYIDKALRCPCSVKNAGQPLPNCDNCLGIGWFFINRTETRLVIQSMKADVRFENWSRDTTGMARVTARAIDKLAFMDRIILKDVEGYYNEIVRTKKAQDNSVYFFTMYGILEVESIFLFEDAKNPLKSLKENVDFQIAELGNTKISIINPEINSEDLTLSIRYRHNQTYHVIDMNRDIVKVRTKGCKMPDEELKDLPINGMIRKSHYLFDNNKYDEDFRLIDNTDLPPVR